MILIDYSQTVIASFFAHSGLMKGTPDKELLRHNILNMLRSYNKKFSSEYGQLIVCADGKNTWRRDVFPFYKANRGKNREESDVDWKHIFDVMTTVFHEIRDELSLYPSIRVDRAEGDDVIAVLAEASFRRNEKCLIISSDRDMKQLQRYDGVVQWSPLKGEMMIEKNPSDFLIEHIIRGDQGDGVPNVFSDDDTFVIDGKRQTPATKKKITKIMDFIYSSNAINRNTPPDEWLRNYDRNRVMIDLTEIPKDLIIEIKEEFSKEEEKEPNKAAFLDYLIKNRMKLLIECIDEFFPLPMKKVSKKVSSSSSTADAQLGQFF